MLESRIQQYLASKLPADGDVSVSSLRRIPGGASRETWSFDAAWRENGNAAQRGFIMRRDPDAGLLETDRDVEFRVMDAVSAQGVPVPKMYWLEPDGTALDRPFFMMERIDGCETSPQTVLMTPDFYAVRAEIGEAFVDILGRIHSVDWHSAGLDFLGAPKDESACAETQIDRWDAIIQKDALEPQPVLRAALRWLRRHQPAPARKIVLVHADYRTGNFLCNTSGEIKGILDWEMTLGDPMEDVAWACMRPWRWLGNELIGGFTERADFYAKYTRATGLAVDEDSVRFWEILGNVKLAAIFLTGARSFCEGRTRDIMLAFLGRNIARLEFEVMDLMGV